MPSTIEVDVFDTAGDRAGLGPLLDVSGLTVRLRRNGAGDIAFDVPLAQADDGVRANPSFRRRVDIRRDTPQHGSIAIAAGIVQRPVSGQRPRAVTMLHVDATDLAGELADRTVGDLRLAALQTGLLPAYAELHSVLASVGTSDPIALAATTALALDSADDARFLYVRFADRTVTRIYIVIDTAMTTAGLSSIVEAQYFSENGLWETVDATPTDGTASGGYTLQATGWVSFDAVPADWQASRHNDMSGYWLRLQIDVASNETVTLDGIQYEGDGPQTGEISAIMALAPAGWSVDSTTTLSDAAGASFSPYTGTAGGTLYQFGGETVLEAINAIADMYGHTWRAIPGLRAIQYLRDRAVWNGVRLISEDYEMGAVERSVDVALIVEIEELLDARPFYTRIYAYGAGSGDARLTLAGATADDDPAWPADYTLAADHIVSDVAETAYGRVDHIEQFGDIGNEERLNDATTAQANQLAWAALTQLQAHDHQRVSYRAAVVLPRALTIPLSTSGFNLILPGDTVEVENIALGLSQTGASRLMVQEIDVRHMPGDLWLATLTLSNEGIMPVEHDWQLLAADIRKQRARSRRNQPVAAAATVGRYVPAG